MNVNSYNKHKHNEYFLCHFVCKERLVYLNVVESLEELRELSAEGGRELAVIGALGEYEEGVDAQLGVGRRVDEHLDEAGELAALEAAMGLDGVDAHLQCALGALGARQERGAIGVRADVADGLERARDQVGLGRVGAVAAQVGAEQRTPAVLL